MGNNKSYTPPELTQMAKNFRRENELDKAEEALDKAIGINPKYAEAYNERGILLQAKKDFPQAIANFSEAIKLKKKDRMYRQNRALAFMQIKRFKNAISDWNSLLSIDSTDTLAFRLRGLCFYCIKLFEDSVCDFTTALVKLEKKKLGQLKKIKSVKDPNEEVEKESVRKRNNSIMGRVKRAGSVFGSVPEIDEDELMGMVGNLEEEEEWEDEEEEMTAEKLKEYKKEELDLLYHRAKAYLALGMKKMAKKDLEVGIKLDPSHKKVSSLYFDQVSDAKGRF